ncbi:hypothetical protein P154DRAFT_427172 [Amniculicola lignicola CBS 123094]|uniref:Uncharacterized protein n=1 Tax=Amniculicola lignicola CBS 123094 TaxID=1392246 RepID=A0A6A5WRX6_9PLEO|nr:hypothetical protein P154DRAFT_427172 [Amniculicola lignicola CBS 123094]
MSAPQLSRRTSRSSGSQSGHHSARVEKPRSNHHSPMIAERRKTTSGTKRYATLDDHYRMMFGMGEEEEPQRQPARPLSWHPSSAQFQVASRSSLVGGQPSPQESHNANRRSDFYSLSTRSPMYQEETHSYSTYRHEAIRGSQSTDGSWQEIPQQTPTYALSSFPTPTEQIPWYLQEWARKNQAQAAISQNGSTDFLPIQHPSHEETPSPTEDEHMEDSGKDLVGMGLYDLPDTSATWSSGLVESTGKGLKLEEGWQPPEENENDDEDEEEDEEADDASSDDGSVDEIPCAKETVVQQHLPLTGNATKPHVPGNMEGQSFFFDEDETYTKEWWYHQLKQPTLPVRDAGLGYGWL